MSAEVRIDAAESALIVVDMQNDSCTAGGFYGKQGRYTSGLQAAIAPTQALLARARTSGMTIAFTRLVYDPARGTMEQRHRIRPLRWSATGERHGTARERPGVRVRLQSRALP